MRRSAISFALLLVACGGGGGEGPPMPDLADPCAPTGRSVGGVCTSDLTFTSAPSLPVARDHHGTAIAETAAGAFLYVTGGTNYAGVYRDAVVAPINADGSLGAFTATTPLPLTRAGHGVFVHGGRLFLVAGQGGSGYLASVTSAPVNADGTLGAWQDEPALPEGRFHIGVVASETHAYAIGGVRNAGTLVSPATTTVSVAAFQSDGHLGPWQAANELPEPRSHHAVWLHEGTLFIVGGLIKDTQDGSPMAHTVLASKLGADGMPGPFVEAGTFDDPVATLSLFELQGFLYTVGGLTEDDGYSARVRRAPFEADGTLGAFADAAMLPEGRSHVHQTPYRNGFLYTMGGSIDYQIVTDEVFVGKLSPPVSDAPQSATRVLERAPTRHVGTRCPCKSRISLPQ